MAVDVTHATTGARGEAHKAGFPPFEPHTFLPQLLWFSIAFGLLYYAMSKIALPKVGAILHDRQQKIARDLEEAQALRTKSQEAETAFQTSLAEARDRSKGIAQETRDKLTAESDSRRKTLEADLAEKVAAGEATIRTRTVDAMSNVRAIAAETAGVIVERLTGRVPDKSAIESALDRTIQG